MSGCGFVMLAIFVYDKIMPHWSVLAASFMQMIGSNFRGSESIWHVIIVLCSINPPHKCETCDAQLSSCSLLFACQFYWFVGGKTSESFAGVRLLLVVKGFTVGLGLLPVVFAVFTRFAAGWRFAQYNSDQDGSRVDSHTHIFREY